MSEKNGKMKFVIGAKMTDPTTGKTEIKVKTDCPATFIITALANLLIDKDNQMVAECVKEAVTIADIAGHSPNPGAMIDKLVKIKMGLLAGAEGDTLAGLKGVVGVLSLLNEIVSEAPEKGTEE